MLPKQETTETSEKSSGTTSQENIDPAETTNQGNIDLAVQLNVGPSPSAEDTHHVEPREVAFPGSNLRLKPKCQVAITHYV